MKNYFKTLVFLIIVTIISSSIVFADGNSQEDSVKRLFGENRYGTSASIASEGWKQSNYAILASGEDFPDAISAAPLAKKYNAPILLSQKNSLPIETSNVLQNLKVKNVFIVGGIGVISTLVENQLDNMGINVTRLSGNNRFETDIKIAEQLENVSEIAIVTGEDYADALSIAPIASEKNMPIILTGKTGLSTVVKNYISSHNIQLIYIVGVGSVIDNSIVEKLSTKVIQINGANKYARNMLINNKFNPLMNLSNIYIATGENYADALSGSALASMNYNPILLINSNIDSQKDFINNNIKYINKIRFLGGTNIISDKTIKDIIPSSLPITITVASIPSLNPDYNNLDNFLKYSEQTKLTPDIIDFSSNINENKDFSTISQIYRKIGALSSKDSGTKFINTSDYILKNGITGCTDEALLFSTIAKGKGIPTIIVDSGKMDWVSDLNNNIPSMIQSHFFVECYLQSNWYLIDIVRGKLFFNYDKNNLSLPENYYVASKNIDVISRGVTTDSDYIKLITNTFKNFDISKYKDPNLKYFNLSGPLDF